ncbi:MAG: hypothetical protein M3429_07900 [Verrucomicrobiota bacterium]|nr:hypothetical protein [Verrucomicrobiota bacterium]
MRPYLCLFSALIFGLLSLTASQAQTPAPVIIQAVTPAPAAVAAPVAAVPDKSQPTTMQLLQEMQATNADTIKKQEAALATLDELQKAAEELKIFSKRG